MKPRVFVGSSKEGLKVARAVQSNLETDADVTVWDQGVFAPGEHTLESLLQELERSDFGVFVFSPDDVLESRGSQDAAVRDNVIFELGLYLGRLGPRRSMVVKPSSPSIRIPSDLSGINMVTFESDRSDKRLLATLGPACNKIRAALSAPNEHPIAPELRLPILERSNALSEKMHGILWHIEREGPISLNDLNLAFPLEGKELFYRLESLRLRSLIAVDDSPGDAGLAIYRAHPDFVAARDAVIKAMGPVPAPPPPPFGPPLGSKAAGRA